MEGRDEVALAKRYWTVDDLHDLPDDHGWHYESLDGRLQVNPPPLARHQHVVLGLFLQLRAQAAPEWRVLTDLGVRLGSDWREPDLLVVPSHLALDTYLFEPVDVALAVEVVSFGSRRTDRVVKPAEYADAGIPRYWRVETEPEVSLHCFELQGGAYLPCAPSAPFPFDVDVSLL